MAGDGSAGVEGLNRNSSELDNNSAEQLAVGQPLLNGHGGSDGSEEDYEGGGTLSESEKRRDKRRRYRRRKRDRDLQEELLVRQQHLVPSGSSAAPGAGLQARTFSGGISGSEDASAAPPAAVATG
eukprot:CAMPEP_0169445492 /NCGR_PEP_ID=MMETSP1042-20121227/10469_1 /TAXON_ID=464988 /ORGANISM="Hemiselmis andersenii, Strain CCMP1180" /LENGTH=125 /DNA_ID=CAMNT_0009556893 /DNA_START=283 /DNA_END=656 /DNA_ORIENTATION=-